MVAQLVTMIVLVFALVSQALANSFVSCSHHFNPQNSESVTSLQHQKLQKSHSEHQMVSDCHGQEKMDTSIQHSAESENMDDCCGSDCLCPIATCHTVVLFESCVSASDLVQNHDPVVSHNKFAPQAPINGLFRPPIFS